MRFYYSKSICGLTHVYEVKDTESEMLYVHNAHVSEGRRRMWPMDVSKPIYVLGSSSGKDVALWKVNKHADDTFEKKCGMYDAKKQYPKDVGVLFTIYTVTECDERYVFCVIQYKTSYYFVGSIKGLVQHNAKRFKGIFSWQEMFTFVQICAEGDVDTETCSALLLRANIHLREFIDYISSERMRMSVGAVIQARNLDGDIVP